MMLELEHHFRVVDVHAQLEPASDEVATRGHAVSPDKLEREMHQAGIVRAVVFPESPRNESTLRSNNAVARMSVDRPFVAFARINGPLKPASKPPASVTNLARRRKDWHTSPDDVEQYAWDERFHGFTLDPAVDGLPDEAVLERLTDADLPVLVRGGTAFPPADAEDLLLPFEFPVILAHFGGYPLNRSLMHDAIDRLGDHENLYLDSAAVWDRNPLERALREHPDRVLFGSGTPTIHPNVAVMEILTLDVPEDAMRRAFSKNPSRVIPELAP